MRNRFHKTSPPENPSTSMRVPPVPEDPDGEWAGIRPSIRADIEAAEAFGRRWRARARKRARRRFAWNAVRVVGYTLVQIVMVSAVVVFGMLAASGVSHQSKWDGPTSAPGN